MKNYKTPLNKILFRCHNISTLVSGVTRYAITEDQQKELDRYDKLLTDPKGLTDNQQVKFDEWTEKINKGESLTENQLKIYEDYKLRLITPIGLTKNQEDERNRLLAKKNKQPELTETARNFVYEIWVKYRRGYDPIILDDKLEKGKLGEEDAISLISEKDGITYYKNSKRVTKDNLTGECDVINDFKEIEFNDKIIDNIRLIQDTKCTWSPLTHNRAKFTTEYEWQGRGYLYLYDGDVFKLRYCLVNLPPKIFNKKWSKYCFSQGINDDSLPEYRAELVRFFREYIYDFDSFFNTLKYDTIDKYPDVFYSLAKELKPLWTIGEREKTFEIDRDFDMEEEMLFALELGQKELDRLDEEYGYVEYNDNI